MAYYYFKVIRYGYGYKNPLLEDNRIIAIVFQKLDTKGNTVGNLEIYDIFHGSNFKEEDIIKFVYEQICSNYWDFIPIMENSLFDFLLLFKYFKKYNLPIIDELSFLYERPKIDIKDTLIIANRLNFKGSSSEQMIERQYPDDSDFDLDFQSKINAFLDASEYDIIRDIITSESQKSIKIIQNLLKSLSNLELK